MKVFLSKRPEAIFGLSKLERKFFQQIEAGRQSAVKKSIDEAIEKLKAKGVKEVKPVFIPGVSLPVAFEAVTVPIGKVPIVTLPGIKPPPKIKEIFKKIEAKIPKREGGIAELLRVEKIFPPVPTVKKFLIPETEFITGDIRPFVPTGEGTAIVTLRQKTFFEKLGINPNDRSSQKLFETTNLVQRQFEGGQITETVANKQLEDAAKKFTSAQIIKGIPESVAFGVAFGLLSAVPIIGQIAQVALAGDIILKRNQIIKQFRKFPVESAASTAGFVAGGLIATSAVKGVKAGARSEINPQTLRSATFLGGKEKIRVIRNAAEIDNAIRIGIDTGKITDTVAYRIRTADGRTFDVLEFSKAIGTEGLKVLKGIYRI